MFQSPCTKTQPKSGLLTCKKPQAGEGGSCAHSAVLIARHSGPCQHVGRRLALGVRRQSDGADGGCDLDEAYRVTQSILGGVKPLVGGKIWAVEENGNERALLVPRKRFRPDALICAKLVNHVVDLELPLPLKQKLLP